MGGQRSKLEEKYDCASYEITAESKSNVGGQRSKCNKDIA